MWSSFMRNNFLAKNANSDGSHNSYQAETQKNVYQALESIFYISETNLKLYPMEVSSSVRSYVLDLKPHNSIVWRTRVPIILLRVTINKPIKRFK